MNLLSSVTKAGLVAAACMFALSSASIAQTFTVKNNCSYTVYPGMYPADYDNGGWSMAPGASVSFSVPSTFNGRIWGRQGCNGASPAQCSSGSCGGSGLQCAGTTGQIGTSLAEWNLDASGTDWYDVSYVDGMDTPIGMTISNGSCVQPNTCTSIVGECSTTVQNGVDCLSPCTQTGSNEFCCQGSYGSSSACQPSTWPANDEAYVTDIHNNCPNDYAYPYDDNIGLHTCSTGSGNNYTITFCPSGSGGGTPNISGEHALAPETATGSRLDDFNSSTTNNSKVALYQADGGSNQEWNFALVSGSNGYNAATEGPYCLDDCANPDGAVCLWGCNGGPNQQWNATENSDGSYTFVNSGDNDCLDDFGGGTSNGNTIGTWTCNSQSNQKWWLD